MEKYLVRSKEDKIMKWDIGSIQNWTVYLVIDKEQAISNEVRNYFKELALANYDRFVNNRINKESHKVLPSYFNSNWLLVIEGPSSNELITVTDRLASISAYYDQSNKLIYIGKRAKIDKKNKAQISLLELCGYTIDDRTIYDGINRQPAGSSYYWDSGLYSNRYLNMFRQEERKYEKTDQRWYRHLVESIKQHRLTSGRAYYFHYLGDWIQK